MVRGGGNGIVFEAYRQNPQGELDRHCAVKMLRRQEDKRLDRFRNEARVLQELGEHQRIAPYYDYGETRVTAGGQNYAVPWIAMELGGTNLRDHVNNRGPLAPRVVIETGIQVAQAIGHLHAAGFVHRDVKPANIVWEGNENGSVLMIDFGIAKRSTRMCPRDQWTSSRGRASLLGQCFLALRS